MDDYDLVRFSGIIVTSDPVTFQKRVNWIMMDSCGRFMWFILKVSTGLYRQNNVSFHFTVIVFIVLIQSPNWRLEVWGREGAHTNCSKVCETDCFRENYSRPSSLV